MCVLDSIRRCASAACAKGKIRCVTTRIWPLAILVSLPIGGYVADLVVDGVDSAGAALADASSVGLTRISLSTTGRFF